MASFQLEGDISDLSDRQKEFLREFSEKNGFTEGLIVVSSFGKSSDNFVANVKAITVVQKGKDDIKIIVKIAPQDELTRKMIQTDMLFLAEILMYEKVFPKFSSLQAAANVPESERFKYAKCYGFLSEAPYEMILLEDLKQKDYTMFDKFTPLDDDAIRLFLKNFAVYHGLSFALKHFEPELFESYSNQLPDMMDASPEFANFFKQSEESAIAVLDDDNYKNAVKGVVSQFFTFREKNLKYRTSKYLVLQQGDAWTNNIMFKVEGGKPVDAIMIDYQLAKPTSPTCDLHFMINNCADHASRVKHYHEWINYYHDELDKFLSNFGLKASNIYPRDQLDSDLKRYSKQFFGMSVLIYGMMIRTDEEANLAKDAMKTENFDEIGTSMSVAQLSDKSINIFKAKLMDLIDSYRYLGYF